MTTDPTPLQERIARALDPSSWQLHDSGTFPPEHQAPQAVIRRSMDEAAAVLPIIAAEVRKAQADALRDAAREMVWDNDAERLDELATDIETKD